MALTTDIIHAAADQLHADGERPTHAKLREVLGGGSYTTISDAMKLWHQEHKEEEQLQQVDLPTGINERLQSLGADMWQTAIDIANDRLAKERDALEVVKAKAQQEVDDLKESIIIVESEHSELLAQLDTLTATADSAELATKTVTGERDGLLSDLADTQKALDDERTAASKVLHEYKHVSTELDDKGAQLSAAQVEIAALKAKIDVLDSKLNDKQQALDAKNADLSQAKEDIAALKATQVSDKLEIARLTKELDKTKQSLDDRTGERDNLKESLAGVSGELKAITKQLNTATSDNQKLADKNLNLVSENSSLVEKNKNIDKQTKQDKDNQPDLL